MINTSFVHDVIQLAEKSSNAYNTYFYKFFPDGSFCLGEDMHKDSPEYKTYLQLEAELDAYLYGLNYEDLLDIEALMMLGRDNEDSFSEVRTYLGDTFPDPEGASMAVDYITSKTHLADYLRAGLTKINQSCSEDDVLTNKSRYWPDSNLSLDERIQAAEKETKGQNAPHKKHKTNEFYL